MKAGFFVSLAIVAAAVIATTAASARAQTSPTTRGVYVWQINDYLKGTAEELRDKVNHEVERLAGQLADTLKKLADDKSKLVAEKEVAKNRADATDEVKALQVTLGQLAGPLKIARESGTPQERLDASAKYVACKEQIENSETAAIKNDAGILDLQKSIDSMEKSVPSLKRAIGSAEKWRREIIDATENSTKIEWPLEVGKTGTLGTVTVKQVIGDAFVASCIINEKQKVVGGGEGIVTMRFLLHPIDILVKGVNNGDVRVGQKINIDRNMAVVKSGSGFSADDLPVLQRTPAPVDHLLSEISALHTNLTTEDLDSLVALSEKKDHPRTWTSVQEIVSEFPPELRSDYGKPWDAAPLQKINDWLNSTVLHDNIDAAVFVKSGRDTGVGTFVIDTIWRSPGSPLAHIVELTCPDSMKDRARGLIPGRVIDVKGTIDWLQMSDDSTLYIKLTNISF